MVLPTRYGDRTALMDARAQAACQWAKDQLHGTDGPIETIGSDASTRRYFRLTHQGQSYIVMDSPPETENMQAFLDIQQRLESASCHVPQVIAKDPSLGFMLLSDLGRKTYLDVLTPQNAPELFDAAIQALLLMQTQSATEGLDHYGATRLADEMNLFIDWFLPHHWHVTPTHEELSRWQIVTDLLIESAVGQPQVFCHRDFMPRNLMISEPNPGIIDFQDALIGPISYDLVSLMMDAFISWPRKQVDQALEDYHQHARSLGLKIPDDPAQWRDLCDWMSLQRHLKVIGIFARIAYRDQKPHYLKDTPRFFDYIATTLARQPKLDDLNQLIQTWRQRAQIHS